MQINFDKHISPEITNEIIFSPSISRNTAGDHEIVRRSLDASLAVKYARGRRSRSCASLVGGPSSRSLTPF
jgi:hypothetical protein